MAEELTVGPSPGDVSHLAEKNRFKCWRCGKRYAGTGTCDHCGEHVSTLNQFHWYRRVRRLFRRTGRHRR